MTTLEQVPAPPSDAVFRLVKLEKVGLPHPYCIDTKHVVVASNQFGGMLGEAAIEAAEKQGAVCCTCKGLNRLGKGRILKYSEHENPLTLFISVPQNSDLNAIPGLHSYLLSLKEANLGIDGFAFPLDKAGRE